MIRYGKKCIGTIAYLGGLIALPEAFAWAWTQLIEYDADYLCEPNEGIFYTRATFSYHAAARNHLAQVMRGDWLLMLDTDHSFEPDLAARMRHRLDRYGLDVLTALYAHKAPPHSPVLYQFVKDDLVPLGDWDRTPGCLIDIGSAGAGTLMVRRRVFDRIRRELSEEPFDVTPPYGEDHSFFRRLRRLGIQAYCDPTIESHHLRVTPLSLADYRKDTVQLHRLER